MLSMQEVLEVPSLASLKRILEPGIDTGTKKSPTLQSSQFPSLIGRKSTGHLLGLRKGGTLWFILRTRSWVSLSYVNSWMLGGVIWYSTWDKSLNHTWLCVTPVAFSQPWELGPSLYQKMWPLAMSIL